jgi:hypothetical protein
VGGKASCFLSGWCLLGDLYLYGDNGDRVRLGLGEEHGPEVDESGGMELSRVELLVLILALSAGLAVDSILFLFIELFI